MLEIKFMVGGREVSPNGFGDAITQAAFSQIRERIKSRLSSVECPEHHQFARVEVVGDSLEKLSCKVDGCCEKLISAANDALR